MAIRVALVGTGNCGRLALIQLIEDPRFELVAVGTSTESKVGVDAGELAGLDIRTGVAATLLLHVLGVSGDDQMAEFLLTNAAPTLNVLRAQSVPAIEARLGRTLDEGAIRALLEVQVDYLVTFQAEVAKDHGSLDRYLNDVIGVDDAMRDRLIAKFTA